MEEWRGFLLKAACEIQNWTVVDECQVKGMFLLQLFLKVTTRDIYYTKQRNHRVKPPLSK